MVKMSWRARGSAGSVGAEVLEYRAVEHRKGKFKLGSKPPTDLQHSLLTQ